MGFVRKGILVLRASFASSALSLPAKTRDGDCVPRGSIASSQRLLGRSRSNYSGFMYARNQQSWSRRRLGAERDETALLVPELSQSLRDQVRLSPAELPSALNYFWRRESVNCLIVSVLQNGIIHAEVCNLSRVARFRPAGVTSLNLISSLILKSIFWVFFLFWPSRRKR